jgi:aldehyde dehydrogenase (NAD+)
MSNQLLVPDAHLHIGDDQLSKGSGGVYEHVYSATGEPHGDVPLAGVAEVDAAVDAAHAAFKVWRAWDPAHRRDALYRLGKLIEANADEFCRLAVLDNGVTYEFAKHGPRIAEEWTSYYAGWADKLEGQLVSSNRQQRDLAYTLAEPYGVVGIIITWNGPLISLAMKVVPAIAAGNTVVVKPSELTPYAAELFMKLVREAGIPAGVVNMVPGGVDAGEALVRNPKVQKVSFTGGPSTARKILAGCAEQLKPAVLELGGKSASLVFPDVNLDYVAAVAVYSSIVGLSGQGCAMPTRLLVQNSIYDEVIEKVSAMARSITIGDPFDPGIAAGPVVNEAAQTRILAMIHKAQSEGSGRLLVGGKKPGGELEKGYYVEPTVFGDVDPQSEIAQVEVFGPVLAVLRFESDDEGLEIANSTSYGLASYLWTNDLKRVQRFSEDLQAGGVYVNGGYPLATGLPFGGLGVSGYGREGGREGIYEFIRTKAVAIGSGG